ncbi:hypothetical protein [Streptomyces sp. NPDC008265]|uniref:hypothetical protein n=1 Tax=Streptomyces sp. NPDC008265 TaxID=3364824 RepID=UPI0036E45F85
MSDQQQPDEQNSRAAYRRADTSKAPASEPGGQRYGEPTLAGFHEHLRVTIEDMRAHRGNFWSTTLYAGMAGHVLSWVEDYAPELAEGNTPEGWGDTLSRENLRSVARAHRSATHREELGDLERLLDDLANEFTLADVRIIRMVAAALTDAMPRMAHKAREEGMTPDQIAQESGYTSSRITQFVRQEKERRAERDAQ